MKLSNLVKSLFWPCILSLQIGCGDSLKDPAPSNDLFVIDNAMNTCKPDAQKFKDFLNQDLTPDLNCIQESLLQFSQTVQTDDPNNIQKQDLLKFVRKFFNDSVDLSRGIDSLFIIYNHFWPESNPSKLHLAHLRDYFDFLKTLNKSVIVINSIFFEQDEIDFNRFEYNSDKLFKTGLDLAKNLEEKYTKNLAHRPLDYKSLVEKLTNETNSRNMDKVSALLFFKKFFVGGEFGVLKHSEAIDLLSKLPYVLKAAYQMAFIFRIDDIDLKEKLLTIKQNMTTILQNLHSKDGKMFSYLSISELPELLFIISDGKFNITPFQRSLETFKQSSIIGHGPDFNLASMEKIHQLVVPFLQMLSDFIRIWDHNEALLSSPDRVRAELLELPPGVALPEQTFARFKSILQNYRFFMHDFKAIYTKSYQRSREGFLFILAGEEILTHFFTAYGQILGGSENQLVLSQENFHDILLLYFDFVIENELWRNPPSLIAANTYLMADFFGTQSDGNGFISIREAVEYLTMQMSSFGMEQDTTAGLYATCGYQSDNPPGASVSCAQENYVSILEQNYPDNLPELFNAVTPDKRSRYLTDVALFARQCPFSSINYNKKDVNLVNGGLISIDATILRFDLNKNDLLDRSELDDVYQLMEKALILRVGGQLGNKPQLLKSVFFYLVEMGKSPEDSQYKFLIYHLKNQLKPKAKRYKNAKGDRQVMASILAMLRNAPKDDQTNIPEDCYMYPYPVPPGYRSTRR